MKSTTGKKLAAAMMAALLATTATAGAASRWGPDYFPNSEVTTQDGETVRFYEDLLRGRMVVISFIYTSCRDLCPINTARLAQVAERLEGRMGKDIFFISISVDPANDTPDRLKAFAEAFYDGPGWTFITGDETVLREIGSKLGNNSEVPANHRNEVVLGNEKTGDWSRNTPFGEIGALTSAVLDLDPVWRDRIRTPPADYLTAEDYATLQISPEPGQALFKKLCAPCHTVGVGDHVGPDLLGATERRDHEWLSAFIQNPEALRRQNDPVAAELAVRFPGVRMPSFGLTETDAADLISYIDTLTKEIEEARADAIAHGMDHSHAPDAADAPAQDGGEHSHHHHSGEADHRH